jgi:glycosyltransferase involved in cell wall biosynthesis
MRLGDLFVRPTRADGDSISVREALGLGVRVLASDVGQRPPGVVRFSVGDPASLAAGARAALAGPRPDDAGADVSARILELWRNPHAPMSLDEVKP